MCSRHIRAQAPEGGVMQGRGFRLDPPASCLTLWPALRCMAACCRSSLRAALWLPTSSPSLIGCLFSGLIGGTPTR